MIFSEFVTLNVVIGDEYFGTSVTLSSRFALAAKLSALLTSTVLLQ